MRSTGLKMYVMLVVLIILSLPLFVACKKENGQPPPSTLPDAVSTLKDEQSAGEQKVRDDIKKEYDQPPPGSLPDADSIPKADQSSVGQETTVDIKKEYAFAFYKHNGTGQERMVVIKHNTEEALKTFIVPLTVYETTFGGIDAMVEQIGSAFTAKIVAEKNISLTEAMHMTESIYGLASRLSDGAHAFPNRKTAIDICYGVFTNDNKNDTVEKALIPSTDDRYLILVGNHQDLPVEALEKCAEVFDVTYKRFDLKQYLPIN